MLPCIISLLFLIDDCRHIPVFVQRTRVAPQRTASRAACAGKDGWCLGTGGAWIVAVLCRRSGVVSGARKHTLKPLCGKCRTPYYPFPTTEESPFLCLTFVKAYKSSTSVGIPLPFWFRLAASSRLLRARCQLFQIAVPEFARICWRTCQGSTRLQYLKPSAWLGLLFGFLGLAQPTWPCRLPSPAAHLAMR